MWMIFILRFREKLKIPLFLEGNLLLGAGLKYSKLRIQSEKPKYTLIEISFYLKTTN